MCTTFNNLSFLSHTELWAERWWGFQTSSPYSENQDEVSIQYSAKAVSNDLTIRVSRWVNGEAAEPSVYTRVVRSTQIRSSEAWIFRSLDSKVEWDTFGPFVTFLCRALKLLHPGEQVSDSKMISWENLFGSCGLLTYFKNRPSNGYALFFSSCDLMRPKENNFCKSSKIKSKTNQKVLSHVLQPQCQIYLSK